MIDARQAVKNLTGEYNPRLATLQQAVAAIPVHPRRRTGKAVAPALQVAEQLYRALEAANVARVSASDCLKAYLLEAAREAGSGE